MTRKQIKEQAARYAKFVEWSEEDKCFIGRCPELMLGGVQGNDEAKACAGSEVRQNNIIRQAAPGKSVWH